ncbi:MAG: hypothetical protein PHP70_05430 [Gallionella sp.]|nr:hypothetical protein [Gallionella sp.]
MVADALREPMFLLLISAGCIYLLLGDVSDALMLMFFVLLVIALTVFQEHKNERGLEALRDLSSPRALVFSNRSLNACWQDALSRQNPVLGVSCSAALPGWLWY